MSRYSPLSVPEQMKLGSPIPVKKARLEIVPLIDIMFFLLASFMLVSLSMTKQHTIKVNLPTAAGAKSDAKPENVNLAMDASGRIFFEKQEISLPELRDMLTQKLAGNADLPVYISGDSATPHGAIIALLDHVRRCGINKVAFNVQPQSAP